MNRIFAGCSCVAHDDYVIVRGNGDVMDGELDVARFDEQASEQGDGHGVDATIVGC